MTTCKVCTAPTGDETWLCRADTDALAVVLAELPELLTEAAVTFSRQDHIAQVGSSARRRTDDRPDDRPEDQPDLGVKEQRSPAHLRAMAVREEADNTLGTWAAHIAEHRGADLVLSGAGTQAQRCSRWLLRNLPSIRLDEACGDLWDEVSYLHGDLEHLINRPLERVYAGPCHAEIEVGSDDTLRLERCERDLYARWGGERITCDGWNGDGQGCRTEHTLVGRREFLEAAVNGAVLPLSVLREAVPQILDMSRPDRRTVDAWVRDGRLVVVGLDRAGSPTFRGADFVEQLRRYVPRATTRRRVA